MSSAAHAGAVLTIDLAAIKSNYRLLRSKSATARCAALVKANAYGTGVEQVAPALQDAGCHIFFVATIDEAIALRGITGAEPQIFVLNGLPAEASGAFEAHDLTPVLNDLGQIERWAKGARIRARALPAAIHFDTGMSRLGLPENETRRLMDDPAMIDGLNVEYVMSHLVSSEEPDNPLNGRQLETFSAIRGGFPHVAASLANSSGVFLGPKYHFDLVRPGVALYGANPRPGHLNPMREVVRLRGENRSSTPHRRSSNRWIWRHTPCFGTHHDRHASIGIRRRLSAVPERPGVLLPRRGSSAGRGTRLDGPHHRRRQFGASRACVPRRRGRRHRRVRPDRRSGRERGHHRL